MSLLPRLASQPLLRLPSQSPKPGTQPYPQLPAAQVERLLEKAGQLVSHEPQLATSVCRSAQIEEPEQKVVPIGQVDTQAPMAQRVPMLQDCPQAPQFVLLLSRVSQPLAALLSQLP